MEPTIDDLKKQIEELKQQKLELEEKLKKLTPFTSPPHYPSPQKVHLATQSAHYPSYL